MRYPSSVVLPDDTVLTTNGAGNYRGKGDSNVLKAASDSTQLAFTSGDAVRE